MAPRRSTRSRHSGDPVPELEEDVPHLGEDDIDEEEDEIEEVTRCICGNPELQLSSNNPDFDDIDPGFFIQCEECQVWQHGYCVGIKDEVDAPDKYWCELCKPELHTLVYKGPKDKRSIYTPVLEKKKKLGKKIKEEKEESNKKLTGKSLSTTPPTSATGAEISEATTTAAAATTTTATTAKTTTAATTGSDTPEKETTTAAAPSDPSNIAKSETSASTATVLPSASPETRHRRERSRGTLNSRDAEYELMLKKALEESAKESGVQPEDPELSEYTRERSSRRRTRHEDEIKKEDNDERDSNNQSKEAVENQPESKKRKFDSHHNASSEHANGVPITLTIDNTAGSQGDDDKKPIRQSLATSAVNDISETESGSVSKTTHAQSNKTKRPRRAVNLKSKSENHNGVASSPKRARSKEEIDADKPTKPRLPQPRISLYEMRKRTSAILEFLVRTQSDLKYEFENGVDITEFIDDNTSKSEINKDEIKTRLENGYKDSVNLMENLTRKIIDWNTKYGESV